MYGCIAKESVIGIVVWVMLSRRSGELFGLCIKDDGRINYVFTFKNWSFNVSRLSQLSYNKVTSSLRSNNLHNLSLTKRYNDLLSIRLQLKFYCSKPLKSFPSVAKP